MIMTHIMSCNFEVTVPYLSLKNTQDKVQLKLNLKQGQQQQPVVLSKIVNNLEIDQRRITTANTTNSLTKQQQQQAVESAGSKTNTSNAWKQFYQQNIDGDTPLHLASYAGSEYAVAALIRLAPHCCLLSLQNDAAQTPLHLAVLAAKPKILRMLLIAGAEPNTRDGQGHTALHLACISGEKQCVSALTMPISANEIKVHRNHIKSFLYLNCARLPANMETRNYAGEACVHLAAKAGHIDVLRSLVHHGANINAREGKSGRTPLHIAIETCNEDLLNFLLDECYNLDLQAANFAGLTSYQVAYMLNNLQMQNKLKKCATARNALLMPEDSDKDSEIESDEEDSECHDSSTEA